MRATVLPVALAATLLSLAGCLALPKETRWRTADEGSFTLEVPSWFHKQKLHPIDSHCGEYRSQLMRLNFDEVYGHGFTPEEAKALNDELAQTYGSSPQEETDPVFIKRVGERYAQFTVGRYENGVKWDYLGGYVVEVFIPDVRGGYLSLHVTYRDAADTATALRIAKSIRFKR